MGVARSALLLLFLFGFLPSIYFSFLFFFMRASSLWNHPDLGLGRVWKSVAERGRVKGNGIPW